MILWDLLQHYQIGEARRSADRASHTVSRAQTDQADLRRSVDTLTLACQAMWELLRERHDGLTDQILLERMREVDRRDGAADGRMTVGSTTCPSCARLTSARTGQCNFCGATLPKGPSPFAGG